MNPKKMWLVAIILAALFAAPRANADSWIDAFGDIKILEKNETEQVGDINAKFGQRLQIRVELEDENYQNFFRNALKTEIITTTVDKTNDPTISNLTTDNLDQSHLQEFDVNIPVGFDKEGRARGIKICTSFIIRTTFLGNRVGYDVTGTYIKERRVTACRESDPTPSPSVSPTPSAEPTVTPSASPEPTPSVSPEPTDAPPITTTMSLNDSGGFSSTGSGAVAACSKTILGKGIKTVVMAIPIVGMTPIAFSLISMSSAFFTTDRRRPEHWVKIVDAVTGKPVSGAIINILTPDGKVRSTWTSDKTGNAGDLLQPGHYEFVVQKAGYVFPSMEEPMFALQSGEFVYRSGLVNFNRSNMNLHG